MLSGSTWRTTWGTNVEPSACLRGVVGLRAVEVPGGGGAWRGRLFSAFALVNVGGDVLSEVSRTEMG